MHVKWLLYLDNNMSKRIHAFPVDEEQYGDWALCGRGAGSPKKESAGRYCEKCLQVLNKGHDLEGNRRKEKGYFDQKQEALKRERVLGSKRE